MCIYVPHMKSLTLIMWPGELYTGNADAFLFCKLPLARGQNQPKINDKYMLTVMIIVIMTQVHH